MTNEQIMNIFKENYPEMEIDDYRPLVLDFAHDKKGITIWTKNGDLIFYFPKQQEKHQ